MPSILAAVIPAPRAPVEPGEFPEPALEPGSLLLRTLYSEVRGTDAHQQINRPLETRDRWGSDVLPR